MTDSTQYGTLPQGTAYFTNYTCHEGLNNNCRVVHAADPQCSSGGGMDYVLQCTRPYSKWIFSLSFLLFDLSLFLFLSVSLCYCLSLSLSFSASLSLSACNENDIRFTSGVSSTHVTSGVRFDSLSGNLEICVAGQYRHVCGLTEVTANPLNIIAAACHQIGYFSKYFFTIIPFMLQCLHV